MNPNVDIDRSILEWLAADRGRLDEAGITAAIASTRRLAQRRRVLGLLGGAQQWPTAGAGVRRRSRAFGLIAAIVALFLVATAAVLIGNQLHTVTVSPTPSAQRTLPNATTIAPLPSQSTSADLRPGNGPIIITVDEPIPGDPNGNTFTATWSIALDGQIRTVGLPPCPAFSPDGRSLAALTRAEQGTGEMALQIAETDGSHAATVWHGQMNSQTPWVLFWSPNSERVALTQTLDPAGPLVIAERANGTSFTSLWGSREFAGESAFSPDGRQLAAIFGESGGKSGIEVGNVGGTDRTLVATASNIRTIAWSPDGTTIAYVSADKPDRLGKGDGDLYFVGLDGTDPRLIDGGDESYYSVVWSPDGHYLAVSNDTGPTVVFDRSGVEVTRFEGSGDYATWSPDSRFLLDSIGRTDASLVEIATGAITKIVYPRYERSSRCSLAWQPTQGGGQ